MKEFKHLGVYGLIIEDGKVVLVRKNGGPYDGKYDFPGGSIEFGETPQQALKRELLEEIGIELKKCELIDADSVKFDWKYNGEQLKWHHIGIFYNILDYDGNIKRNVEIDDRNNDSLGAEFYTINDLKRDELSEIVILELEKIGYTFN